MIWLVIAFLILGYIILRGAPYVPTRKKAVQSAMQLLDIKPGELLIDLGSGDGVVLRAAASRGARAIGYELNPVLFAFSWLSCLPFGQKVSVRLADYWLTSWPSDTDAIFVFSAGPFMAKLAKKLKKIKSKKTIRIVSYGFEIPGLKPIKKQDGLILYRLPSVSFTKKS